MKFNLLIVFVKKFSKSKIGHLEKTSKIKKKKRNVKLNRKQFGKTTCK
jgi:hypothetical protein